MRAGVLSRPLTLLAVLSSGCGTSAPAASTPGPHVDGGSPAPDSGGASTSELDSGSSGEAGSTGTPPDPPGSSGGGSDAGDAAPPTCSTAPQWSPGDSKTIALDFGDAGARSYDVYVGKGVKPGTAVPLLVNMHGLTNSPALQAQFSQMNPVADANGFVVVYPAGLNASFNAGSCCGTSATTGVDDVGFVRAVVADAESKICIDSRRVYETGFSNGGMMAYELACHASDLFAAVAPTEGDNQTVGACTPSRPVPLAAFQYLADPVVTATSAQQSVQAWATKLGCTDSAPAQATDAAFACQEWSHCSSGSLAWYCTLPGGTHYPPAGSAPVIWSFLSQFQLP